MRPGRAGLGCPGEFLAECGGLICRQRGPEAGPDLLLFVADVSAGGVSELGHQRSELLVAGGHPVQLGEHLLAFGLLLDTTRGERVPIGDFLLDRRPEVLFLGGLVLRHGADQRVGERSALVMQLRRYAHHGLHPVEHLRHLAVSSPEHLEHIRHRFLLISCRSRRSRAYRRERPPKLPDDGAPKQRRPYLR